MQWERTGLNRARLCGALALIICATPIVVHAGPTPGPAAAAGDAGAIGVSGIDMRSDPAPIHAPAIAAPIPSPIRPSAAQLALPRPYPVAPKDSVSERMFGELVADPWRWLEGDVHADKAVADWVSAENRLSRAYLDALPGRAHFAERLRALYDSPRISVPRKAGHRYFFLSNSGLLNQSALYVRDGLGGADRLLLDPNAARDAYAIDGWVPSHSGRWLAYAEQRNGSDWRTIRVIDADTGALLDDRLDWANDTLIGWLGDVGFFYSRYPAPPEGDRYRAALHDKAVWFHRVGTPQSADSLVYATPDHPEWGHKALVTSDGRWAVISTDAGAAQAHAIHLIDLAAWHDGAPWTAIALAPDPVKDWRLIDGIDNHLWFITDDGAPNGQVVRIDMGAHPHARVVLGEGRGTLQAGRIVGDRLILSYLSGGQSLAMVTDLAGRPARAITIDAVGAASGFDGRPGDPETFYQFSSYNQPPAIWRMDLRTGRVSPFANPPVSFNPADYVIEQREYPSRDGTMVPLTVVRKRSLAQAGTAAPTLLYGYGGFDIALNPGWSPWRMAWLEAGGVFAVAAVRGGGELGPSWYEAGRGAHKQNSFDDFIAAGEYLLKSGIARPGSLAAQGGSNGGMMVAAVINQRPDLFAAANPDVGVMDMLRFDRFTQGRAWIGDYGDPAREADWHTLRAYSPYHNIHGGAAYPAILVTTADTDDRVVPAHSFKYVAALQDAAIGDRPHLLRVETDAGHGAGRPLDKAIAGGADVLAFLAAWTGLSPSGQ